MSEITRTFQISDPDLSMLERCVPLLHEICSALPAAYHRPDVQIAIEECKRILSDVRWGYGPFRQLEVIRERDAERG